MGASVGGVEGAAVGTSVGFRELEIGRLVREKVGAVGDPVGTCVEAAVGDSVGLKMG